MDQTNTNDITLSKAADWEVDFYSRPVLEPDGKKRWELLISSTEDLSGTKPFRWVKICPASEVNSIWLSNALQEALLEAQNEGWHKPLRIRAWRASMKTMLKKASAQVGIDIVASRRTYSLTEWMKQREQEIYPKEIGYLNGPIAPPPTRIINQPTPLPEAVRGEKWSLASLPIESLREAREWPIEFSGLVPINKNIDDKILIPGIRLFSQDRAFALAGWLGGLEPVKLAIEGNQLLLEAGQEDRWLVTDLPTNTAQSVKTELINTRNHADGLQFIAIQSSPEEKKFTGFWMLRDIVA